MTIHRVTSIEVPEINRILELIQKSSHQQTTAAVEHVKQLTTGFNAGSFGGGSSAPTILETTIMNTPKGRRVVQGTSPPIGPGETATLEINFTESCDMVSVTAEHECWIRVYATAAARAADAARFSSVDPTPGQGIMGEVWPYGPDYLTIGFSPVPFFNNLDSTMGPTAYIAITNKDSSYTGQFNLTFIILPQEQADPSGPQGLPGPSGYSFITSTVDPLAINGKDGDGWFNKTTEYFFGPKANGAWPAGILIKGSAGSNGTNGLNVLNGTSDPTGSDGVNGEFWINKTSWNIFGPKAGGSWPGAVSLVGPQGVSAFTRQTATYTTASLANNAVETGSITLAKSCDVFKVTCTSQAWVRLYVTSAARTADASRLITVDPTPGSGCILDVQTSSTVTLSPVPCFYNADGSPTTTGYLSVTNTSGGTVAITVTLAYVPKES